MDDKPGIIYPALFALQIIILLSFREYKYVSKWGRLFILTTLVNMKFKVVANDFLSYIFSVSENTKIIHLIMMNMAV